MIERTLRVILDRDLPVSKVFSMVYLTSMKELIWSAGKIILYLIIKRALAKQTDGDFGKFVDNVKKPRDEAQKWRAFKNIARAAKNPFGYVYWKVGPLIEANRIRFVWCCLIWHLYQSFLLYVIVKTKKENMIAAWRYRLGEMNDKHGPAHRDRRFPVDRKKNYVWYSNFHQVRRNKRLGMIYTNWWCRDQNFRKYFEMRKRHDIRPSESGFYHEQIFNDVAKQNASIAAMRHSQAAKWWSFIFI